MQTEIEAKFLSADHEALRRKLEQAGAKRVQPMRLMRRKNYDFADGRLGKNHGWVRVRDEGDKITLSYKQQNERSLHGVQEINLTVDSFEAADAFLVVLGLEAKHYQETKRESWRLGEVEIELDQWPWVQPFVEIEGPDEASVRAAAEKLGLAWDKALHGSVEVAYQAEYDVSNQDIHGVAELSFGSPVPASWRKRDKE